MFRKKSQFTHFERGTNQAGEPTMETRRYNVVDEEPEFKAKPEHAFGRKTTVDKLEPIDELEADTDVRDMIQEAKEKEREQNMTVLRAKHSELTERKEMKLADLRQKKEMKSLKGDIRKMKYAPLYKTGSGLKKLGTAVKDRDSGFVGGGQDKVSLDEGSVGNNGNGKSDFFSFGRGDKVDWGGNKKTELGLATGKSNLDFGAKSSGKIDFSLGMGRQAPKKRRKKPKKKTTKKKAKKGKKK